MLTTDSSATTALSSATPAPRPVLFVHVPKTGSTSIRDLFPERLSEMAGAPPECKSIPRVWANDCVGEQEVYAMGHVPAVLLRPCFTEQEWNDAFVVAFVRNPWAREVSMWSLAMEDPSSNPLLVECGCTHAPWYDLASGSTAAENASVGASALRPEDSPLVNGEAPACTLGFYLSNCTASASHWLTDVSQTSFVSNVSDLSFDLTTAPAAVNRVSTSQVPMVDFIGREENLRAHLYEALVAAGNSASASAACAGLLPHETLGTDHDDYTTYWRADDLPVAWVRDMLNIDAVRYGYGFNKTAPLGSLRYSKTR
jgi:hypothetical protein